MTDFLSRLEPPRVGWLVVGMLAAFIAWGAFATVTMTQRSNEQRQYAEMRDSLQVLISTGRCVWIQPRDTVRRRIVPRDTT